MPGVHRRRKHRTGLPFEGVRLLLAVGPDFGGAAPFDNDHDLFIHVALGMQRAARRDFDTVAAPFAFRAEELDESAVAAHALPRLQRHVLDSFHADAAKDRDALALHEIVIGCVRPLPGAVSGVLQPLRLMPMFGGWYV